MATSPEAGLSGSSSSPDVMGDDSALHDSVMFGEDVPAASPDVELACGAKTAAICPSAKGNTKLCAC